MIVHRFLVGLILAFVMFLFMKFINILLQNKHLFSWWRTYNGHKYNDLIDLFAVVLSFHRTSIYKTYIWLFDSVQKNLEPDRVRFIYNRIINFRARPEASPNTFNFMLPRHLCESILFSEDDNDPQFNSWLASNNLTTKIYRTYNGDGSIVGDSPRGLYPNPTDTTGWRHKFVEWGVVLFNDDGIWRIDSDKTNSEENKNKWNDFKNHPDNVFRLYQINPKSEIVYSLCNDVYKDKENTNSFKQIAVRHLIGYEFNTLSQAGGWLGFVKGTSNNSDTIESIYNLQYEGDTSPEEKQKEEDNKCGASDWLGASMSGIGAMLPMAVMMAPFTAGFSLATAGVITAVAATGVAAGAESIASNPCKTGL